jgi:hypothetical protein
LPLILHHPPLLTNQPCVAVAIFGRSNLFWQLQLEAGPKWLAGLSVKQPKHQKRHGLPLVAAEGLKLRSKLLRAFLRVPISSRCSDPVWVLCQDIPDGWQGSSINCAKTRLGYSIARRTWLFPSSLFRLSNSRHIPPPLTKLRMLGNGGTCWAITERVPKVAHRQAYFFN